MPTRIIPDPATPLILPAMKRMRGDSQPSAASPAPAPPPASSASATPVDHHITTERENIDDHENGTDPLATSPAAVTSLLIARQRPAYEKLAIGPLMVFGEMITGEYIILCGYNSMSARFRRFRYHSHLSHTTFCSSLCTKAVTISRYSASVSK